MTATPDDTIAELQRTIAELRRERDAARARRNSEYGARIGQQSATDDDGGALKAENQELRAAQAAGLLVLQAMVASPGDTQPVFDLIARQAADLCEVPIATVAMFDGTMVHLVTQSGFDATYADVFTNQFPRTPSPDFAMGRAILNRRVEQIEDTGADTRRGFSPPPGPGSALAVPLLRDGSPLGVIAVGRRVRGPYSKNQITLLQTFAEQAVIAISGAETFRALQTRTADLQESLEYQTATSDVLKVISQSAFDLQPILDTVAETAVRLCDADQAAIARRDGEVWRLAANSGFPPEYEAYHRATGGVSYSPDSPTVTLRAALERRPVHIHDVAAVPGYPEAAIREGKQRTSLGVPLLREGEAIGTIVLARQRVEPFTERQIELVSTFADQAVIAIENARLNNEQREALEQQTATAEVLQVINASPGDLIPVFDVMLEKAHRICNVDVGSLWTYDGTYFRVQATRGHGEQAKEIIGTPYRAWTVGRALLRGDRVFHTPDLAAYSWDPDDTVTPTLMAAIGMRALLVVPLRKDGALLGMITSFRRQASLFSDKEIALLENFAAQAIIAMENARLLGELQQRTDDLQESLEYQTATAEVLQVINASPGDLRPVFDAILEKAHQLCGAAVGSLVIYDGEFFNTMATHGFPEQHAAIIQQPLRRSARLEPLISGKRLLHVADVKALEAGQDEIMRNVVERTDLRTALTIPLRREGNFLGFISAFRQEVRLFSEKEIALLENFAAQAVIAIESARLLTEQREALDRQTAVAEVLQVINASPGNVAPVFDAMLERALRLCEAAFGALHTYDGERFHAVAMRGVSAAFVAIRRDEPMSTHPDSPPGQMLATKRPVQVPDAMTDPFFAARPSRRDDLVNLAGARSVLNLPLLKGDTVVGAFVIYRKEPGVWPDSRLPSWKASPSRR